ncbi:hypothetical protein ACLMJK_002214 [Lecanora helva]
MTANESSTDARSTQCAEPASRYPAAKEASNNLRTSNHAPKLTAEALSYLQKNKKSQLEVWFEEPQFHEVLALGRSRGQAVDKIEKFFDDVDKNPAINIGKPHTGNERDGKRKETL